MPSTISVPLAGLSMLRAQETLPGTRIVADHKNNIVTIFIDGVPAMRLDKEGLHVTNDIIYGGTIQDSGAAPVTRSGRGG